LREIDMFFLLLRISEKYGRVTPSRKEMSR
jgi:hypothetical protein